MSVLVSQEADVHLANLANGRDTLTLHAKQLFWHSRIYIYIFKKEKKLKKTRYLSAVKGPHVGFVVGVVR